MNKRHFSAEQIEQFWDDGYTVVPNLFDANMMARIDHWTRTLEEAPETPGKIMKYFEKNQQQSGGRILTRIENFCPYHQDFNDLVHSREMIGRISELFSEEAVLFKDKINFKKPGGAGFTPHQDVQAGWDNYADIFITVLVSIDAATKENGCLELARGFNKSGLIGEYWEPLSEESMKNMTFVPCPTQPGDAVFFDSFAPHQSGPNNSAHQRRVLYITYNRLSAGDHRARYYADKRKTYPPDCERDPNKVYEFKV